MSGYIYKVATMNDYLFLNRPIYTSVLGCKTLLILFLLRPLNTICQNIKVLLLLAGDGVIKDGFTKTFIYPLYTRRSDNKHSASIILQKRD